MKEIKIGYKLIGDGHTTFIIAEAGLNHDGNPEQAKELINEAKKAGADAVKFQIYYIEDYCNVTSKYYGPLKSIQLDEAHWKEIAQFAASKGIMFTSSVFCERSANLLEELGSPAYKIASGDLTHFPLLRHVSKKNKPVILSTGMATIGEVDEALWELCKSGNRQVALLHCVSNYPARFEETNLRAIRTLKNIFKIPVGLSDHSTSTVIPAAAVAMGANIIEKHFTLDNNLPGADHSLSLEPEEFRQLVENIRAVEKALGDGLKRPTESEKEMRKLARRSITAKADIAKGSPISADKLKVVRPGTGIGSKFMDIMLGKTAKRNIKENETISWEDV